MTEKSESNYSRSKVLNVTNESGSKSKRGVHFGRKFRIKE